MIAHRDEKLTAFDAPPFQVFSIQGGIGLQRRGFPAATCEALDGAYRVLFRKGLTVPRAVEEMRSRWPDVPEVEYLARFAETSARGLTR